jgi:shikimate kinase
LQDIVDTEGYEVLRKLEEDALLGLAVDNCVIATGGSAVYSDRAMAHLKARGLAVFLDVDCNVLESRIHDYSMRGLAKSPDQNFAELFQERFILYSKYADITINPVNLSYEEVCKKIMNQRRELLGRAPGE